MKMALLMAMKWTGEAIRSTCIHGRVMAFGQIEVAMRQMTVSLEPPWRLRNFS